MAQSFHFTEPESGWSILGEGQPFRHYSPRQLVYLQGETDNSFYYLKKGRVCIFLISDEGDEKTVTFRESGSIFGEAAFFDGKPRTTSARTITECQIVSIGRAELTTLFRTEPSLALQMLQVLARTVRMLSGQLDTISFLSADRRLAGILVALAGTEHVVHNSQEELGNLVGVTRITVNRVLHIFAQKGWLTLQYRSVKLTNPAALAAYAQE